jgi:hypothetical protein
MYSLDEIKRGIIYPKRTARELNRLVHTKGGRSEYNPDGEVFLSKDWDNLIILDACRYDTFNQISDLTGDLRYKYTKSSATYQFIRLNFKNRNYNDIVYISANNWYLKLRKEINSEIHSFVDLQDCGKGVGLSDDGLTVVSPQSVTDIAIEKAEQFPNKRIIVHYLQPHHPFIGPVGRENFPHQSESLLNVVRQSDASDRLLYDAYKENLKITLPEVQRLLNHLYGKSIVTADHGEMLGDRHDFFPIKDYGHHPGIHNDATTKVPWLINQSGDRKKTFEENPQKSRTDMNQVDETLRNLGYKI